ncbi:MAG: AzlC family ABC transporter permease [Deferribacteraceae bacterium]|jgi:4-azaleucine resistance transporter AzlC|nr:AzlC family ABC transporter permease [Deferribacteraceae bacterium]
MSEKYFAFKVTIPILLGYLAIGCAFGLIVQTAAYPWYTVLFTSILIFAGAAQYALAGMFVTGASFLDVAIAVFLINSRHLVYGLSVLDKFKGTMPYTPYLIFGLTDETFGVLSTVQIPPECDRAKTYFYITLFDHSYWILGGLIGFFLGSLIPFDFAGVDFALTSLFVVLLVEQWKHCNDKAPFAIAAICSIIAIVVVGSKNMLIVSFLLSLVGLLLLRRVRR